MRSDFKNFGLFVNTDLAPERIPQGLNYSGANEVIFIDHVLNLVPRLSLLCLRNEVVMCIVSSRSLVFMFASRPGVLFLSCLTFSSRLVCFHVEFLTLLPCTLTARSIRVNMNHGTEMSTH